MPVLLALGLCSAAACNKKNSEETEDPGSSNLLGPKVETESVDDLVSSDDEDEDGEDSDGSVDGDIAAAEQTAASEKAVTCKEPPKSKPVQKCTGKGKKRVCKEVDAKPEASAAFGVCKMMGQFKWGQSPDVVFKYVTADIEKEYEQRQAKSQDPIAQDNNQKWRREA
ncbi:MAG: hypothetical protein IAG13_28035, partial [Deltaproteobacteria bacterium]|nr:hypothetical protein [Nannocystaceae bacterium]